MKKHKGKIIAQKGKRKIIDCKICKFKHLYPLPSAEELKEFYQKRYFDLIRRKTRAPQLRRLMKHNKEAASELTWLSNTLYKDIDYVLKRYIKRQGSLIDIGCGGGDCLRYMKKTGWKVMGIEPSEEMAEAEKHPGISIYNSSLEDFIINYPDYKNTFDAAILLNVLEHVPEPARFLKNTKKVLKPRTGMICIRVPNDFSPLQECASQKINKTLWWVAMPDHINYFDCCSLSELLRSVGFKIIYTTTDFPMELFLLMGDDYVNHPAAGGQCHKKRINFELSLPDDLRRAMYRRLCELDMGRDLLIFARARI